MPSHAQIEQFDVFRAAGRDSQDADLFEVAFGGLPEGPFLLNYLAVAQFASEV
jgi:hypothetical protein